MDPNWAETVTAVATGVGSITLLFGGLAAKIALRQAKSMEQDRYVQLLTDASIRYDSERMEEARNAVLKYGKTALKDKITELVEHPTEDLNLLLRVPDFYEGLAINVECGSMELDLIWRSWGGPFIVTWSRWEAAVDVLRKDDPGAYREFEALAQKLKKHDLRKKLDDL